MLSDNGLNKADVGNADETDFVFNVYDGRTLGSAGQKEVRFAEVLHGGESITMMVK